jgi:DNA-binding response OmpR family regulator/two-component sensor histidine kinase
MKLECTEVDITKFVINHSESFESLAKLRNIRLEFSAGEEDLYVYIDGGKISQVLNNLLSNAFKFTGDGGRIRVSVRKMQLSGSSQMITEGRHPAGLKKNIMISIEDSGRGIPQEKLLYIFDRFYQVDDSMSREQEGTGIGLAIVKEMVTLHHGQIEVESKLGEGTIFRIYLPMGSDHLTEDQILQSRQPAVAGLQSEESTETLDRKHDISDHSFRPDDFSSPAGGLRVKANAAILLIVEDNPGMRSFIRGYFQESYEIIESGNGQDGLEKALHHIPDIIISDVMMPKLDGYAFCQAIKTDERTCHIPLILLTARASRESRLEGLEKGADDFVIKPFDGEELQARVKNLIDQRKKLSEHYRKDFEALRDSDKETILSLDEKFLHKAKAMVEKSLSNPEYGVGGFASDMALSCFQLHRKLTALMNQSATEFIRTIRLNYAIRLLKNRAGTISEIAYDAGFNNPTYFSISFKKQFGISPSEYLAQLEQNENY